MILSGSVIGGNSVTCDSAISGVECTSGNYGAQRRKSIAEPAAQIDDTIAKPPRHTNYARRPQSSLVSFRNPPRNAV